MKKLVITRRISQAFFLGLFVYILWSTTYPLEGVFPPEIFFRANPLIILLTSISERIIIPGVSIAVSMLVLTVIFGRFFCGWICPLGTTIDIFGAIKKKRGELKKIRGIRSIKLFILGVICLFAFAGIQIAWVFDPMVIFARFVSLNLIPTFTLALNSFFVAGIKNFNLYGPVYDFYRMLKTSILGIKVYYFSNAPIIFLFFVFILATTFFLSRLWCRALCPLGAIYSLFANFSFLERHVDKCSGCGKCVSDCRMGAIKDDASYIKGECVLCMDCIYDCHAHSTRFAWKGLSGKANNASPENGVTRREFMFLIFLSLFLLGAKRNVARFTGGGGGIGKVIRPPGALREKDFVDRCIRCGNCMKVCITNGLQPVMLQSGLQGLWTPELVPEIGYCEYNCNLCGNVCPTGAIPKLPLEKKKSAKLGLAEIDKKICIAWADNMQCIVCQEHCPISDKAIKLVEEVINGTRIYKPYIDKNLCVGCGICQNKCPVRPVRAIKVTPEGADRA